MNIKSGIVLSGFICSCISLNTKVPSDTPLPITLKPKPIEEKIKKKQDQGKPPSSKSNPLKKNNSKTRTITVKNAVTDEMTCYKKFNQKYKPDVFTIRVNGTPLTQGKSTEISVANDTIKVEYDFSFANGWYKGTRKKSFKLDSKANTTKLTFEWNNEHRVSLAGAKVDTLS